MDAKESKKSTRERNTGWHPFLSTTGTVERFEHFWNHSPPPPPSNVVERVQSNSRETGRKVWTICRRISRALPPSQHWKGGTRGNGGFKSVQTFLHSPYPHPNAKSCFLMTDCTLFPCALRTCLNDSLTGICSHLIELPFRAPFLELSSALL